jgi:RNA polymerase sigma-70 factor (ECF subfamily)
MTSNSQCDDPNVVELKLVASIASGDRGALATLYDQYSSLLMGLGMKILNDRAEVEDLLHDVFVEVWQKAGSYDPARGSVRTWLCLRMRSRGLDRSKLSRRTRSESLTDSESAQRKLEETSASQPAPTVMRRERLLVALQALPDAQRKVIAMAYFSGLSCSEIADSLKVPIGTVKSRLAGARRGLERAVQGAAGAEA